MNKMHITTSQRAIAYILLASHLLTSCGWNVSIIQPKKEETTQQKVNKPQRSIVDLNTEEDTEQESTEVASITDELHEPIKDLSIAEPFTQSSSLNYGPYTTVNGEYQVLLKPQERAWEAQVKNLYHTGLKPMTLPAYINPNFPLETLSEHPQYIHINIPFKSIGHVHIGAWGLLGGGNRVSSDRESTRETSDHTSSSSNTTSSSRGSSTNNAARSSTSTRNPSSSSSSSRNSSTSSKPTSSSRSSKNSSSSSKSSSSSNKSSNSSTRVSIPYAVNDIPSMPRDVKSYIERSVELLSKGSSTSSNNTTATSKTTAETKEKRQERSENKLWEMGDNSEALDKYLLDRMIERNRESTSSASSQSHSTSSRPEVNQKSSATSTTSNTSTRTSNKSASKGKGEHSTSQSQPETTSIPKETMASKKDKPTVSSSSTTSYSPSIRSRSRSPRRYSPTTRSSSPARSTGESKQRKGEEERLAKQKQAEEERRGREAATQKEWDQFSNEIQAQYKPKKVNSLSEAYQAQTQLKSYIEKVKVYTQYSFLNSSTQQMLQAIEKALQKLETIIEGLKDAARYGEFINDIDAKMGKENEEFDQVQDKENAEEIINKAKEFKIHTEAAIKQVEGFKTKQDKTECLTQLKENLQTLEEIIQQQSEKKEWLAKYKAVIALAGQHVAQRIEQEKEHLIKQVEGKPSDNYTIHIEPKPGVTISQIKAMFSGENNTTADLQKLLDSLSISVNFSSKEEESGNTETEASSETTDTGKEEVQENEKEKDYDLPGGERISHSIKLDNGKTINIDFGHSEDGISADHAVNPKLVAALRNFLNIASKSCDFHTIYISTTTNGKHGPQSNHYVKKARALDISGIDGKSILEMGPKDSRVIAFQNALEQLPNINENFGPALFLKQGEPYLHDKLDPKTYDKRQKIRNQHFNHIHFSVTP